MKIIETGISDLVVIEPTVFGDERGFFLESWNNNKFRNKVGNVTFVQDNHSKSDKNVLRGLHIQTRNSQAKLVRVVSGSVLDVAVDLRKGSKTFGQHFSVTLTEQNKKQLFIPKGFAHGFLTLETNTEFLYKCDNYYDPSSELSLLWNDPDIGVDWGKGFGEVPVLSSKDSNGITFADYIKNYG